MTSLIAHLTSQSRSLRTFLLRGAVVVFSHCAAIAIKLFVNSEWDYTRRDNFRCLFVNVINKPDKLRNFLTFNIRWQLQVINNKVNSNSSPAFYRFDMFTDEKKQFRMFIRSWNDSPFVLWIWSSFDETPGYAIYDPSDTKHVWLVQSNTD